MQFCIISKWLETYQIFISFGITSYMNMLAGYGIGKRTIRIALLYLMLALNQNCSAFKYPDLIIV